MNGAGRMKKIKKKSALILVAVILSVLGATVLIFGRQGKIELVNPRTDAETLQKWFPNIEGVDHVLWEVKDLSSNSSRVPGPSAFWSKGFICLKKEAAAQYKSGFEWETRDIKLECETIDTSQFDGTTWYYSKAFEDEMKPASYLGNFYFNGEVIWFDVTR